MVHLTEELADGRRRQAKVEALLERGTQARSHGQRRPWWQKLSWWNERSWSCVGTRCCHTDST
jgi:hypothetical protein